MSRALVAGVLAAMAMSCGTTPKCGPANCPLGCCDATGVCLPGTQPLACGSAGATCTSCLAGTNCLQGTCFGSSGSGGGTSTGGGTGGGSSGNGGGSALGNCAGPGAAAFVNDTFESSGVLAGAGSNTTSCSASTGGPDQAFAFSMASPGYVFGVMRGSATLAPTFAVHDGSCAGSMLGCGTTPNTRESVGLYTSALAAGSYVLLLESQAGNGGSYSMVLSRSTRLGDDCADARPLTLSGSRALVAGDTSVFSTTFFTQCDTTNGPRGGDAIYSFVAPRSGTLTLTANPAALFNVTLAVYSGPVCSAATMVGSCSNLVFQGSPEIITMPVTVGTTYWVRVGGFSAVDDLARRTLAGAYTLELSLP